MGSYPQGSGIVKYAMTPGYDQHVIEGTRLPCYRSGITGLLPRSSQNLNSNIYSSIWIGNANQRPFLIANLYVWELVQISKAPHHRIS